MGAVPVVTSYVTLGLPFTLLVPQFPHLLFITLHLITYAPIVSEAQGHHVGNGLYHTAGTPGLALLLDPFALI